MSNEFIKFIPDGDGLSAGFTVYHKNGFCFGRLLAKEDGFYDFWQGVKTSSGFWPSHILRAIADKLDELNAPWDKQINEYFDKEKSNKELNDRLEYLGSD